MEEMAAAILRHYKDEAQNKESVESSFKILI